MKHIVLSLALLPAAILSSASVHNLWLLPATANQITIGHEPGSESYVLHTTGTDPFVSVSNLERPLAADETVLTFEYTASMSTGHFEIFFHYPATAGISKVYLGLPSTTQWRTATFDISGSCNTFAWGAMGDQLRLDFGGASGNVIQVRNIRISRQGDIYTPRVNPFSAESTLNLGLPVLEIATDGAVEPTCDFVSPPEGSIGGGITNATKVPGRVRIINPDGKIAFDSGEYEKKSSGMTVKIRGNTSAYTPKKPYKIKLEKKADMLCSGDKAYADKNWVLLKDESQLLCNGFKMCELTGQQWSPRCQYVNVVFNGRFRGLYLLAEGVERNTSCRLNVADDGFIAEMDAYWWNEDGAFFYSVNHPVHNYTLKYPDYEDLTEEQKDKIQVYLTQFENSIESGDYTRYIDTRSFATWLVAHDMLGTLDSAGSNMLLTRYDLEEDTPILMGNLWDFDSTEQMYDTWSNVHTHNFTKYFNSPDKTFTREYIRAYNRLKDSVFTCMMSYLAQRAASDEAAAFERSLNLDNELWTTKNTSGIYSANRSISWYSTRWTWMNNAVNQLAITSGIDAVNDDDIDLKVVGLTLMSPGGIKVYDTTGRLVAAGNEIVTLPSAGLYLVVTPDGARKILL